MGEAGEVHCDDKDSILSLANITVLSDVGTCEPGRFHLTSLGIYTQLSTFRTIYFTGRLPHAGTAPLGPPGKSAPKWACRCVVVSYPPGVYTNGVVRQALAAIPFLEYPLYLTPEMVGVKYVYDYRTCYPAD